MDNRWIFFNDLKDTSVRQANHDKTGTVDNVVLDLQSGRIALFTLSSGGFLGIGEEKVALPPDAIEFRKGEADLRVEAADIHRAPGTATAWPERFDSTFIDDVHRHYGYRPITQ